MYGNCSACQEWTEEQPGSRLLTFLGSWSGTGPYFVARWQSTLPPPAPLGLKMLKWLLEKYDLADALYHLLANAVISGDEDCFDYLISQPEQFHQAARQSTSGAPPLMELAVKYGRVDMLPALSKFTGALNLKLNFFSHFTRLTFAVLLVVNDKSNAVSFSDNTRPQL